MSLGSPHLGHEVMSLENTYVVSKTPSYHSSLKAATQQMLKCEEIQLKVEKRFPFFPSDFILP